MDSLMTIPGNNGHGIIATPDPITVTISKAAADHMLAWSLGQRTRSVHELGHLLAATVLGLPVNSVSIKGQHEARVENGLTDDDHPEMLLDTTIRRMIVVYMAGLAAEIEILGEGSNGNTADIASATRWANARLDNGLEKAWPPVSTTAVWPFGGQPSQLLNLQSRLVVAEVTKARAEAQAIMKANSERVLALAGIVFHARRLDGESLDAALRAVGLEPAPRGA